QRVPHPAPEGQARQPQQRLERGGVRGGLGAHGGRGRTGGAHHPLDGGAHAARLRDGLGGDHARGARPGGPPRRASQRLRQAPLNSIWEGSGNVICLDVMRAMVKEPASVPALIDELAAAKGADRALDAFVEKIAKDLTSAPTEADARSVVERLALALQATLMV